MTTIIIAPTAAKAVLASTLKQAPARLLTFLQAVGSSREIATLLAPVGWSDARMQEAWALLNELPGASPAPRAPREAPSTRAAVAACEAFQTTGFVCARAMLEMTHPEQASVLFDGLLPGKGTMAVLLSATFLDRCETLRKGEGRKVSRKADHEALEILALTGTTKEKMRELRTAVEEAQSRSATPDTNEESAEQSEAEALRLEGLRKIYAWITAWSEMARVAVKRRDYQVRLGIARQRPRKNKKKISPVLPVSAQALTSSADDEQGPASRAA